MTHDELLERYFLIRILWWRAELESLSAEAIAQLVEVLKSVKADIAKRLTDEAEGLASVTNWTKERLQAVEQWADEVLAEANAATLSTITDSSVTAAATSLATYNAIVSLEHRAKNIQTVGMTTEQIRSWFQDTPLGGGTLAKWVNGAFDNGVKLSILSTLRKAGVEGKGTAATVKRLLQSAVNEGFRITQREAATLTRTYIQTANVQAMDAVYQRNSDIIKGVKRVETLDNKTCLICALADGETYALNEPKPALPAHPNCRGVWTPITKSWRDLGITAKDLEDAARSWAIREPGPIGAGGRLKIEKSGTSEERFSGWWFSLSEEDQLKTAIGPIRRKLLLSGDVKWKNLWDRKTGFPYTLRELGYDEQGNKLD